MGYLMKKTNNTYLLFGPLLWFGTFAPFGFLGSFPPAKPKCWNNEMYT
jgi:hypothetical protein